VSRRLFHGFRHLADLMLLTPTNWEHVLQYGKPDILLVESTRESVTGHWHIKQLNQTGETTRNSFEQMMAKARKQSIPTAFWITKGHELEGLYAPLSIWFDHVFCADEGMIQLLEKKNIKSDFLGPCAEPTMHNSIQQDLYQSHCRMNLLFDGWADLDHLTKHNGPGWFSHLAGNGLSVIESRRQFFDRQINTPEDFEKAVLGCVTQPAKIAALKSATAYLIMPQSLSTPIERKWMALEAAACRVPLLYYGNLSSQNLLSPIALQFSEGNDLGKSFVRLRDDRQYWKEQAIKAWRQVHSNHVFIHRLQKICSTLSVAFETEISPLITLITVEKQIEDLERSAKNFVAQTYPNKEWIAILNDTPGITAEHSRQLEVMRKKLPEAQIYILPQEMPSEDCLKYAKDRASGKYWSEVDHTHRDPHYLHDLVLMTRPGHFQDYTGPVSLKSICQRLEKEISDRLPVDFLHPSDAGIRCREITPEIRSKEPELVQISSAALPAARKKKKTVDVSVIIPVFNKGRYVSDCLDSLLNSRFMNIEVICVDDCSTDDSRVVIQNIAKQDSRVKLISQGQNQGASVARNTGIRNASGEFLFFLDADDIVIEENLKKMLFIGNEQGCDIVRGKITGVRDDGRLHTLAAEPLLHNELKHNVIWQQEESLWYYWYFTANIYRTAFVRENCLSFPTGMRNEDPFFLCRCFLNADNITLFPETVYHYRIGAEQTSKTPSLSFLTGWSMGNYYLYQLIQNQNKQAQFFKVHFPSLMVHSANAVNHLDSRSACDVLRYVKLIFQNADMDYYKYPDSQPWNRKKSFKKEYVAFLECVKSHDPEGIYDYIQQALKSDG
jgi:glycosyltransferase involved in cell wall biosynthesis